MATAVVAAGGAGERLGAGDPEGAGAARRTADGRLGAWRPWRRRERVSIAVIARSARARARRRGGRARVAPRLPSPSRPAARRARSRSPTRSPRSARATRSWSARRRAAAGHARELFDRCVERLEHWGCDGVVAAARAVDTIKEADAGGRVIATLERASLWVVQTPQVFRPRRPAQGARRRATSRARHDDAQLVEAVGGDIRVVEAPRQNLKVTTQQDLRIAELLLAGAGDADRLPHAPAAGRRRAPPRREYFTERNVARYRRRRAGAGDRRARLRRARLPVPRGARRLAPPVLGGEARGLARRLRGVRAAMREAGYPSSSDSSSTTSRAGRSSSRRCSRIDPWTT